MLKEINYTDLVPGKQYYIAKYTTENKLYFKLKATFGHCINHLPVYAFNGNALERSVNVFRNYSFIPNQHTNSISYDNIYSMYHGYYFDICNNLYMEHSNINSTNVKYFLCEKDTIIKRSNERLQLKAMQSLLQDIIPDTNTLHMITKPYFLQNYTDKKEK
jgi:hypothetical protein